MMGGAECPASRLELTSRASPRCQLSDGRFAPKAT